MSTSPILASMAAPGSAPAAKRPQTSVGMASNGFQTALQSATTDVVASADALSPTAPSQSNTAQITAGPNSSPQVSNSDVSRIALPTGGSTTKPPTCVGEKAISGKERSASSTKKTRDHAVEDETDSNAKSNSGLTDLSTPVAILQPVIALCAQNSPQANVQSAVATDQAFVPTLREASGNATTAVSDMRPHVLSSPQTEGAPVNINSVDSQVPSAITGDASVVSRVPGEIKIANDTPLTPAMPDLHDLRPNLPGISNSATDAQAVQNIPEGPNNNDLARASGNAQSITPEGQSPSENSNSIETAQIQPPSIAKTTVSRKRTEQGSHVESRTDGVPRSSQKTSAATGHVAKDGPDSLASSSSSSSAQPAVAKQQPDAARTVDTITNSVPKTHKQETEPPATSSQVRIESFQVSDPPQLVKSGELHVSSKGSELKISVQLPELGKVEVHAVSLHNVTTAHLTTSRQETLEALVTGRNDLEQALRSRDVVLGSLSSQAQSSHSQGQSHGQQEPRTYLASTSEVASSRSDKAVDAAEDSGTGNFLPDYSRISVRA